MRYLIYVLTVIFVMAFSTNPDIRDHQYAFEESIMEISGDNILAEIISHSAAKRIIVVDNYYLCSVTRLKVGVDEVFIGFGFFGEVFILTDKLKEYDL